MFETILVLYATDFNWIPLILQIPEFEVNPTLNLNPETWPIEFDPAQLSDLMNNTFKPSLKTNISVWKTSITEVLYGIVAVFASVGGFLIFCQYMQANDQAQKNFIKFLTGLAIIGLAELIVTFFIPAS